MHHQSENAPIICLNMGYKRSYGQVKHGSFGKKLFGMANMAANSMARQYISGGAPKTRRPGMSTSGVTTSHFDRKQTYKYKRMPRKKRKRYLKKVKFVKHVINKQLGQVKAIFGVNTGSITSSTDACAWFGCTMNNPYPQVVINSGATQWIDSNTTQTLDIENLWQTILNVTDGSVPSASELSTKISQTAARMNCTISNVGSTNAVLDIYTIVCRKDLPMDVMELSQNANQITTTYNWTSFLATLDFPRTSAVTTTNLSMSLFCMRMFCQYFKIVKVQQIQLPAGDFTTLSMNDNKTKTFSLRKIQGIVAKKGWTKGFIFKVKGVPDATDLAAAAATIRMTTSYQNSGTKLELAENEFGGNKA